MLWTQPEWTAGAHAWIARSLEKMGLKASGPIEQPHVRPWSTVMHVPTSGGVYFFKAAVPELAGEVRLTLALAERTPGCMPEVAAADAERGWMLTRDAGTPLRELLKTPEDLRLLDPVLPLLVEVQMAWLGRQDELIALGAADSRVETLPDRFARLAEDRAALMVGEADGLSEAQHRQIAAAVPRYAELCARLLSFRIPQSIHYDDMHSGNIFLRVEDEAAPRITFNDWGDSCASHPFCSLLIFLRAMSDLMGLPEDATEKPENMPPMLARLRDAYLEPWQILDTRANLVETFNLAWRVGMVARALSWQGAIQMMPERCRADYRYTVPAWLGEFLLALD